MNASPFLRRDLLFWSAVFTLVGEAIAVALRQAMGITAVEFNRTAPLWLQVHHMFWSVPLLALAWVAQRWPRPAGMLAAVGVGCIASDLLHHFVVLPLTVGNTGWHWP